MLSGNSHGAFTLLDVAGATGNFQKHQSKNNHQKHLASKGKTTQALSRLHLQAQSQPAVSNDTVRYHPSFKFLKPGGYRANAITSPSGFSPQQMQHVYGIDSVRFGGVRGDGAGQTVAVISAYYAPTIANDLTQFSLQFGLPVLQGADFTYIDMSAGVVDPTADATGSWELETALDVEWVHAIAPRAKIVLYTAASNADADLFAAVSAATNNANVSVVTMSFGAREGLPSYANDKYLTTGVGHKGITFVASTGDSGAYDPSNSSFKAIQYPASSTNVVGIGGTTLTVNTSDNSYVSETGWGHGTTSGINGGSGGGISAIKAKPSYQNLITTPSATKRTTPDVAFPADPNNGGVSVYDSWDATTFNVPTWVQVGGTSLAAPMWAGVMAIIDQGRVQNGLDTLIGASQTLPALYSLPASDFHDIIAGDNGYAAGVGYDLVTGRGSPILPTLITDLVAAGPQVLIPTIASMTASPNSVFAGTSVSLTAVNAQEPDGAIASVSFYRETNGISGLQLTGDTLVGTGAQSGSDWSLSTSTTGFTAGSYTYYAVATDATAHTSNQVTTQITILPATPVNDVFANASSITGVSATATGANTGASKETFEPNHANNSGGKSIWWNWTAPSTGKFTLDTAGSNFDTTLGVYTGASVAALTKIVANDDASGAVHTSAVSFVANAGTTYRIAVDGYRKGGAASQGNVTLNLAPVSAPANDNFANSTTITGITTTWSGSTVGAVKEAGEPNHANNRGGASVWLTWIAPTTKVVQLNTLGSNFDTTLAVYTGSAVNSLTLIASNDDTSRGVLTSALSFNAVAGTTYRIAIDGYNGANGAATLNLS